jgi:hypothetical protein
MLLHRYFSRVVLAPPRITYKRLLYLIACFYNLRQEIVKDLLTFRQVNQIAEMIIFEKVEPSILQCIGHLDLAKDVWITPGKMC